MTDFSNLITNQALIISGFVDYIFVTIVFFIAVFAFLIKNKHYSSGMVFLLSSVSLLYSFFLKQTFKYPRPYTADMKMLFNFDIYGFPSTHVLFYTVFWGFIIYLTFKYNKRHKILINIIRWLSIYFLVTVGLSRVWLGYHFFQDVAAGYIFGLIFLLLLIWLDRKLEKIFSKNKIKDN